MEKTMTKKMPLQKSGNENTYFVKPDDIEEMHRLAVQDRLLTQEIGFFPEGYDTQAARTVLDLACGSGGWALDLARSNPHIKVVGIDISKRMIDFDQVQAEAQGLHNASFQLMDVLQPLDFPDASFDVVNARLIFGFMPPTAWPTLLQECCRILRSGGLIRLTECESVFTNSIAFETLSGQFNHALQRAGKSFSPDGRNVNITPMLSFFLREAKFQNVRHKALAIECSKGTDAYEGVYQDLKVLLKLVEPFLFKWTAITPEEADRLYQQALVEMQADTFCALWYNLSAWGEKQRESDTDGKKSSAKM